MLNLENIKNAALRINSYIKTTPILTSSNLNKLSGANLYFKCENFQKTGSFKFRGACNTLFNLSPEQLKYGVATASSGNHGAAIACAAALRNIKSYIVMPKNAVEAKKFAVYDYGAEIEFCDPEPEARQEALEKIVSKTGATIIHPYENEDVIAGQGTAAMEILLEQRDLDIIIAPVGGGGLLAGSAIAAKNMLPGIKIFGAEPETANDAYLSFKNKKITPASFQESDGPCTICDGLLAPLGTLAFSIFLEKVDNIYVTSEQQIIYATRLILERMKIVAEPSAAITLAVILDHPEIFSGKKIGIILSGGNLDIKSVASRF